MFWGDMLIERAVPKDSLRHALGKAFGVATASVTVITSVDEWLTVVGELVLWVTPKKGDFRLQVGVYPDARERSLGDESAARVVARELCCRVLVSDDSPNPFTFIVVDASGAATVVSVEPEGLDREDEEFWLVRTEPGGEG